MSDEHMNDKDLGAVLHEWAQEAPAGRPDRSHVVGDVVGRLGSMPRRPHRWPFSVFRRSATSSDTSTSQPDPHPVANGHTPTVTGRTSSMLSPVKAITAGALVFAVGGAFLIAQPFGQEPTVPGAETQTLPTPVGFSSTYDWRNQSTPGSSETLEDGVTLVTGEGWAFSNLDSSDPRFAGPLAVTSNIYEFPGEGAISVGGYRIETSEGAWQQVPAAGIIFEADAPLWRTGALPPADNIQFGTFVGEGDYEGLIAVYQETWWPDGGDEVTIRLDGYVIDGDLPDPPEPWMP